MGITRVCHYPRPKKFLAQPGLEPGSPAFMASALPTELLTTASKMSACPFNQCLQVAPSFLNFTSTALNSTLTFVTTYHRIPLGCSCLMTNTLPEAILPTLQTQYFGGRATG